MNLSFIAKQSIFSFFVCFMILQEHKDKRNWVNLFGQNSCFGVLGAKRSQNEHEMMLFIFFFQIELWHVNIFGWSYDSKKDWNNVDDCFFYGKKSSFMFFWPKIVGSKYGFSWFKFDDLLLKRSLQLYILTVDQTFFGNI